MSFEHLGLSPKVLAAISAAGYATPTPIQEKAIPIALLGRDVLGIAQTGTGKTASFVLPMLTRLESGRARARMPRSLILAPTRELAAQVAEHFERYGKNHKLSVALLIGGVSMDDQVKKLDRGVDVLIATPGRMLDHFQRGRLLLTGVEILVIDEADRMLDMGFIPDIERICSLLPPKRQTLFFSATMPTEIKRLVDRFLKDPERIEVTPQATTAGTITQRFTFTAPDARAKRAALRDLIITQEVKNAIIFCNRKRDVDIVFKSLSKHGFNVGCLHGDMDQRNRTMTLDQFRAGSIQLLAASDVAARGLDIPDVSHIFNYDVPIHAEDYVHRVGRTGRAGRKGFSATLVTDDDIRTLKLIEGFMKAPVEWLGVPPPEDAGTKAGKRKRLAEAGVGRDDHRGEHDRGRRRGSERGPRRVGGRQDGSGKVEAVKFSEPDAAPPPAAAPAEAPAGEPAHRPGREPRRRPRPERGQTRAEAKPETPRTDPARPATTAPQRPDKRDRPPRQQEAPKGKGQNEPEKRGTTVGLGDHMPAFMRRPSKGPGSA